MELEEILYSIEYRPGTQNQLPDYLSRKPNLEIDTGVSSEEEFEEKIYAIDSPSEWLDKVKSKQVTDKLILRAVSQLIHSGIVSTGPFKGSQNI